MKRAFIAFNEGLLVVEKVIICLVSAALLVSIFWQVLCRYLFLISTPWAEELARYSFICLAYIGAGGGIYYSQFVSIDLIDKILESATKNPEKWKILVDKLSVAVSAVFLVLFGRYFWKYFLTIAASNQHSLCLGMKMTIPLSSILIGSFCMFVHAICLIVTSKEERVEFVKTWKERKHK